MEEGHVGRRDVSDLRLAGHRGEPGGKSLERAAPLGGVLDDPNARRERRQVLVRRADHDDRAIDSASNDSGNAVEQRRAVPLEARLRPPHAGRAAPGEDDTGYRGHTTTVPICAKPAGFAITATDMS